MTLSARRSLFLLATLSLFCIVLVSRGRHLAAVGRVESHVRHLADDSTMGRKTPSPALDEVADWLASKYQAVGLAPLQPATSFIQRYGIETVVTDRSRSYVRSPDGSLMTFDEGILPTAPMWRGKRVAEAILVEGRSNIPEALSDTSLIGKHVVIWSASVVGASDDGPRHALLRSAAGHAGQFASVVIVVPSLGGATRSLLGPMSKSTRPELAVPSNIMLADREAIEGALDRERGRHGPAVTRDDVDLVPLGPWVVNSQLLTLGRSSAANVVGVIEGSWQDRFVVVSAHFDHIGVSHVPVENDSVFNGADDNASGVAALLEAARSLVRAKSQLGSSIVIAAFSGEEQGLWGSSVFPAVAEVRIRRIVANINLDMVGRDPPEDLIAVGDEYSSLGATIREAEDVGALRVTSGIGYDDLYTRSDNYSFARKGVAAVLLTGGLHDDYHQLGDHADRINGRKLVAVADLTFRIAMAVSRSDEVPAWDAAIRTMLVDPKWAK